MAHFPIEGGAVASTKIASATPPVPLPAWRRSSRLSLKLFAIGAASIPVTIGAVALVRWIAPALLELPNTVFAVGSGICTALFAAGVVWSVIAVVRMLRSEDEGRGEMAAVVVAGPMLVGAAFALFGAFMTLWATMGFARGRQLRRHGKVLLPPVAPGSGWARIDLDVSATPELRGELAARWRENGCTEHASVAAFARLTLDLIALGAPPQLIEAANRDSMDEIRHADLCFSIARALDGLAESPGPFPAARRAGGLPASRTLALAQLAVSSLIDGALHEGLSARVIARLVKRCDEPVIRDALRELAADEGRHAAHGWDVVEWCLSAGGAPVAHALRGAVRAIPRKVRSDLPEGARDGNWERYGVHGAQLEAEEHAKARADVVRRVNDLLARVPPADPQPSWRAGRSLDRPVQDRPGQAQAGPTD